MGPRLYKSVDAYSSDIETAVIAFNGEVLTISFVRGWTATQATAIRVRRWTTGELLAEHPWSGGMGCAIVKDGVIHIFGSTSWASSGNKVIHSTLGDDFTPSMPSDALLMNAPQTPFKFFNTSVTADPNGFRMVLETTAGVYFARSTDLSTWVYAGGQLSPNTYCGCPSINYIDGAHYVTWLVSENGKHVTKTAKSTDDCFTFTYGGTLLAPYAGEGTNNSDVDFVELNGRVFGVYLDGDQSTWWELKTFTHEGTLAAMFAQLV